RGSATILPAAEVELNPVLDRESLIPTDGVAIPRMKRKASQTRCRDRSTASGMKPREGRKPIARGASPGMISVKNGTALEGRNAFSLALCRASFFLMSIPGARAPGYFMSPHPGLINELFAEMRAASSNCSRAILTTQFLQPITYSQGVWMVDSPES